MLTLQLVKWPSQGVNPVCLPPECFLFDGVAFLSTQAKWYKKPTGPGLSDCAHGQPQIWWPHPLHMPCWTPSSLLPRVSTHQLPGGNGAGDQGSGWRGLLPTVLVLPWSHLLHCPLEGHKDGSTNAPEPVREGRSDAGGEGGLTHEPHCLQLTDVLSYHVMYLQPRSGHVRLREGSFSTLNGELDGRKLLSQVGRDGMGVISLGVSRCYTAPGTHALCI